MAAPATVSGEPAPEATGRISPGRRREVLKPQARRPAVSGKTSAGRGAPVSRLFDNGFAVARMPFSISAPQDHCEGAESRPLDITSTSPSLTEKTDHDTALGVVVYVCRSCRSEADPNADPRPGAALAQTAVALGQADGVDIRSVNCLANCKRGLSAAMRSADGWSYMFGALSEDDAADLVVGARLLSASPDGLMPWRGRPDSLKRGLVARIPPLNFTEETS